ncbi:MAG TPA: hypothetical protein VEY32_04335 [Flavisolibacter sp.]|nr:hypothetical protein [Flavisolibacter sp.]
MEKPSKPSEVNAHIAALLASKSFKAKEKVIQISQHLLDNQIKVDELVAFAAMQKGKNKATLIESMEYVSKIKPEIVSRKAFLFVSQSLKDDEARVKWESAKVIRNSAHLFPKLLKEAIVNLLSNTEHDGTVVRWSAAGALAAIISCKTSLNKELIPAVISIQDREQDNAIKKIYHKALKKV